MNESPKRVDPSCIKTEWPRTGRNYLYSNFCYDKCTRQDGAVYYILLADVEFTNESGIFCYRSIIGISTELPLIEQMMKKMEILY